MRLFDNQNDDIDEIDVGDEWTRRLTVERRTILMRLMNIDAVVSY